MKYLELIEDVDRFEKEYELTECMYFGAIEKLKDVQKNLEKLDDVQHVERVIKLFLIQWGNMNRVVGREGLDWKRLGEKLSSSENDFSVLRNKKLLLIDFDDPTVSNVIVKIYEKLDPLPYLGSPTTISKILHLLNPEVFVMWDNAIVEKYREMNHGVNYTSRGYLEFLKVTQKEIKEALKERQKATGKRLDEVENEIRLRCKNKTLAKIVDEYNWINRPNE
jgi:hypothetical protein